MWPFARQVFVPTFAQWTAATTPEQYAVLQKRLYRRHVRSLPRPERLAIDNGSHPSLSHEFADAARPYVPQLAERLATLGIHADVGIALYHYDRIVLTADLVPNPVDLGHTLPALFQGFEIKYAWLGAPTASLH